MKYVIFYLLSISMGLQALFTAPGQVIVPTAKAAGLSQDFGVVSAAASLSSDSQQQTAVDKTAAAGFGWNRQEFTYSPTMNFAPYDAANAKLKAKGIKTLGLLTFSGTDRSHDDWKNYVQAVTSHFGTDVSAWEIMNEADNYLSPADYTTYLREAHDIIKVNNPNAIIVLSGITSRPETPNFWKGVAAAGGWDAFDVAGLHVYHSGNPEKVNFGGGDLLAEYDRALASLKKNGGGKKIWITETGSAAGAVGNDNQANWLARTLVMTQSVSSIEKVFVYRLYDDGRETYGLTDTGMNERPVYGAVRNVIANLSGIGTRLYPQSQQILDGVESTAGWSTKATTNGSLALTAVGGKSGNALKLSYNFTADQAYAVAEKSLPISGTPQAIAAWFYGDDTKNVWKYRFKDAKGETFQADLGNLVSGWNYKQFTIGRDAAYVSWDGDGKIDYPISFNSIVVDRQGGDAIGSGMVDEIAAIYGGAELQAYQFGDTVAYWTAGDSVTARLCGGDRSFTSTPQLATGVNCAETPKTNAVSANTATAKPAVKKASPTPTPLPEVAAEKSLIRVDGSEVVADGSASYRIVMLLKTATGELVKNQQPTASLAEPNENVVLSTPVLVGDEWWVTVTSKVAGDIKVTIAVGKKMLQTVSLSFTAVPSPVPTPSPSPSLSSIATASLSTTQKRPNILVLSVIASGGVGIFSGLLALILWYSYKQRGIYPPLVARRLLWPTLKKPNKNGRQS